MPYILLMYKSSMKKIENELNNKGIVYLYFGLLYKYFSFKNSLISTELLRLWAEVSSYLDLLDITDLNCIIEYLKTLKNPLSEIRANIEKHSKTIFVKKRVFKII